MKKTLLCGLALLLPLVFLVSNASAQTVVSGKVTSSDDGAPLPGVNVLIKNTTRGTSTDFDGNYRVELQEGDEALIFSFVGYVTEEIEVGSRNQVDITLTIDISELQEIVVVGYGTQQEKDLTSAIATLDAEDIVNTPTGNAVQSLQGKVAGVQITNLGAPGAAPNIRIRGLGSFANETDQANPLFVVDGMFVDNIDFLNTADIASMSVLKDASAASIYGVRGANGVVLIETKSGDYNQPVQITYNGYFGVQVAQNVLQMTNAEQYVNYINASGSASEVQNIEDAIARYGRSRINPNLPNVNTDWYDEVSRTAAPIQNHSLGLSGGNERTRYSVGASYFLQEGLLDHIRNDYERFNLRVKLDAKATERLRIGGNVTLSNARQYVGENAIWQQAYLAIPVLPVFDPDNVNASPTQYANAQDVNYRGRQNPFFVVDNNDNRKNIGKILGSFYAEVDLMPNNLSFKTAYNYFYQNIVERNVDFAYNDGRTDFQNGLRRRSGTDFNQIWDNILTYKNAINNHAFTITAGYSYRSEVNEGTQARGTAIATLDRDDESTWYIPENSGPDVIDAEKTFDFGNREFGSSYFSRIEYNYLDRYLVYGSFRRDGTNKFSEKWGNFFTIGGGWVLSQESFFNVSGIDFLKIRGGWGQTGNDGVNSAIGQPTFDQTTTVIGDQPVTGIIPNNVFDLIDTWETTEETNIGLTANFLNSRLSLVADVYRRDTKDAVLPVLIPGTNGTARRNAGSIRNQGIELALGWSDQINSNFSYNVSVNFATNDNEVLDVGNQPFRDGGSAEFRQRSEIGSSLNEFFGYEIVGVFQTDEDIQNSGYTAEFISDNSLVPGDFFFRDQNDDGVINSDDRVFLGSFIPTYTYGVNLGLNYKNWSFSAFLQGQGGNTILNRNRGTVINTPDANIDKELATGFWTGPGSTNRYPSAEGYRKPYNHNPLSEFLLEDGDYFRIQNVRLAYSFKDVPFIAGQLQNATLYFVAERPLTVFDYNGFNPEVVNGVDSQTYPIAAVYSLGLDITF